MSMEVSLAIIAFCLVVLVIFLIFLAIYLIQLLVVLKHTTQSLELKVNPILEGTQKILNITTSTTERIKSNIELTTPLFHSIGKVSTFMEDFPNRFKNEMHDNTMSINFEAKKGNVEIGDWAEWIASGIVLIHRLRK